MFDTSVTDPRTTTFLFGDGFPERYRRGFERTRVDILHQREPGHHKGPDRYFSAQSDPAHPAEEASTIGLGSDVARSP
jgi:hypothetical protein